MQDRLRDSFQMSEGGDNVPNYGQAFKLEIGNIILLADDNYKGGESSAQPRRNYVSEYSLDC